ncbi:hypothetical protein IDH05_00495 [Pelagibacterales bacterium SAG-MED27]|nr:hypothetical protein [Pelagibacterales bacterium SAG-MED27]
MKRLNPKTRKPFKLGDKRQDGFIFSGYKMTRLQQDGYFGEAWSSIASFKKSTKNRREKKYLIKNPSKKGKYKINPSTKKPWKPGDINPKNGSIFRWYKKSYLYQNGYFPLHFEREETYHKRKIRNALRKRKIDKKEKFNLDNKFLFNIFPKDFKCPALGIKMFWDGQHYNSPSLDRLNPKKYYTKDNVCWISYKANTIKTEANYSEIIMVGKWMKKMGI